LAFSPDLRPILFEPGPDHLLIAFLGSNHGDLWAPTRGREPSGQVMRMVRDAEAATDPKADPSQGPAVGLESRLQGSLAKDLQGIAPLRAGQPGRSSRPGQGNRI
jgi:hypothetical protein